MFTIYIKKGDTEKETEGFYEARLCLECNEGLIIGDREIPNNQKVYCFNCGKEHTYNYSKKNRTVKITKKEKFLSKEKLKKYNEDNKELYDSIIKKLANYIDKKGEKLFK